MSAGSTKGQETAIAESGRLCAIQNVPCPMSEHPALARVYQTIVVDRQQYSIIICRNSDGDLAAL